MIKKGNNQDNNTVPKYVSHVSEIYDLPLMQKAVNDSF
jgi:hypothetical protein